MDSFGIKSDSTIYNVSSFFCLIAILIIIHLIVLLLNKILSRYRVNRSSSYTLKILKWIIFKFYVIMSFSLYIRLTLETNQYLLISWLEEIKHANTSSQYRTISLMAAILVFLKWLAVIFATIYLSWSSYKIIEKEHNKLSEFFDGLKSQRSYKFYSAMILLRRLFFYFCSYICYQYIISYTYMRFIHYSISIRCLYNYSETVRWN